MKELTRRGLIFGSATIAACGMLAGVARVCQSAFADDDSPEDTRGPVKVVQFTDDAQKIGLVTRSKVKKSRSAWKKQLTPLQFDVTRRAATEFAYSGALFDEHAPGLYRCIDCGNALFDSITKFDSATGWPSYWAPIAEENVYQKTDTTNSVVRQEVKCTLCEAHLGHLFPDGPQPSGLRYCMNSAALRFLPRSSS